MWTPSGRDQPPPAALDRDLEAQWGNADARHLDCATWACAMADGVEGLIATMTATLMALPRRSD